MKSIYGIKRSLQKNDVKRDIARKLYLSYTTEVFRSDEDKEFYIKNRISNEFNIPFNCIEIVGSGKTGVSFFKDRIFEKGKSDLDMAIISLPLFNTFAETAYKITKGYTDLSTFPMYNGSPTVRQFKSGIIKGFINPFYMPDCELKNNWLNFFNHLSNDYYELFKNINGGIYASEFYFESKQEECIDKYLINPRLYDEISGAL